MQSFCYFLRVFPLFFLNMDCYTVSGFMKGQLYEKRGEKFMDKRRSFRKALLEFLLVNLGLMLTAIGIVLFKAPNGFAMGGVSGLAIVIAKYLPNINLGIITLVINVALLFVGFAFLGRDFGLKTVYASIALSFFIWLGEEFVPLAAPLTGDAMLELFFAIAFPALGSAIVFNQNSSTGGTDIIAKILSKKTHIHVGKTLLLADFLIACSAFPVLGVRAGLYSVLGLALKGFLIDIVIENLNMSKKVEIITTKPEPIQQCILRELHRGVTVTEARGAYTNEVKQVLTVVVSRQQAYHLRECVGKHDPGAFVIVSNALEIIGKGFRNTNAL